MTVAEVAVQEAAAAPKPWRIGRGSGSWLVDGGIVALVVGVGFALFRPEWYANQNGLDPYFYTGLSLNFADSIAYGAEAHYFLSRWTLYLPELLSQRLLGASVGFVAARLLLLAIAGLGLARLRPPTSRRLDLLPVAVLALFSPLVARSVFVDYSDAVVVPCGIAMVALAARGRVGLRTSAVLGILGAAAVIANAFAIAMVAITVCGYLARTVVRPRRLALQMLVVAVAGAAVVVLGLVFFRWRYGIENVYQPTFDFVRANAGSRDPLKSPRLQWLEYRLWIYLPPIVLGAAAALRAARLVRFGPGELVVLATCAVQYAFQVTYQFVFDGITLELGYYFSYMVPAFTAALAVVLYAVLQRCSAAAAGAVTAVIIGVLTAWRHLPEVRLASWAAFAVGTVIVTLVSAALCRRAPAVLPCGVAAVALAAQLAPPGPEPFLRGELPVPAGYTTLYRPGPSSGVDRFRSASRFIHRMNTLDADVRRGAGWVIAGERGPQLAATYSVQVGLPSRWLNPPLRRFEERGPVGVTRFAVDRFVDGGFTHVVVLCNPDELAGILTRLAVLGVYLASPVLDYRDAQASPETQIYVAPVAHIAR